MLVSDSILAVQSMLQNIWSYLEQQGVSTAVQDEPQLGFPAERIMAANGVNLWFR
ncbi:MAG: hypothetical protein ACSLEL_01225 [Candidatus Malihini olakiniferum]